MPVSETVFAAEEVDCVPREGGSDLTHPALRERDGSYCLSIYLEAATALKVLEYIDELRREAF